MAVVILADQISKQSRKLEIQCVLAAYVYFEILDLGFGYEHLLVHLEIDGVGILAVKYDHAVILGQAVDTCKTL